MSIMDYLQEKKAEFNAFKEELTDKLEKEATEQYEKYVGPIAIDNPKHNNDFDAYRHAYVSARLTQLLGGNQSLAEKILDGHEVDSANVPYEHRMDGWNNEVGRRFGNEYSKEDLGKKLAAELKEGGLLVTSPYDKRLESLYSQDPKLQAMDVSDDRATAGEKGLTAKEMDQITDDASREIDKLIDARDKEDTVSCIDNIELMEEEPFDSLAYAEEIALSVYNPANDYVNDNDIARA